MKNSDRKIILWSLIGGAIGFVELGLIGAGLGMLIGCLAASKLIKD